MINCGVNPFVVDIGEKTQFDRWNLSHLTIPKISKSVYFSILPDESYPVHLQDAWYYTNGSFEGKFDDEKIGEGSEGIVLRGEWMEKEAAFKFVQIHEQKVRGTALESLKDLNKRLTELNVLKSVEDTRLIKHYGHYRQVKK